MKPICDATDASTVAEILLLIYKAVDSKARSSNPTSEPEVLISMMEKAFILSVPRDLEAVLMIGAFEDTAREYEKDIN